MKALILIERCCVHLYLITQALQTLSACEISFVDAALEVQETLTVVITLAIKNRLFWLYVIPLFLQDASGTEESNDAMGEAPGEGQQPPDASEVPALYPFVTV